MTPEQEKVFLELARSGETAEFSLTDEQQEACVAALAELAELRRDRDRLRSALRKWCFVIAHIKPITSEGFQLLGDAMKATTALKVFDGEDADAEAAAISAFEGDPKP